MLFNVQRPEKNREIRPHLHSIKLRFQKKHKRGHFRFNTIGKGATFKMQNLIYSDLLTGKPVVFKPNRPQKIENFWTNSHYRQSTSQNGNCLNCAFRKNFNNCEKVGFYKCKAAHIELKSVCNFFQPKYYSAPEKDKK